MSAETWVRGEEKVRKQEIPVDPNGVETRVGWGALALALLWLSGMAVLGVSLGLMYSKQASAQVSEPTRATKSTTAAPPRIIYPKKTELDFEGLKLQGEVRNPGEFYFERRPQEKFNSLVKPRPHFHQEMLRDAVLSR